VLAEDEGTGDEADEEGEEVGDHGSVSVEGSTTSTLTMGPRSEGVCGDSNVTITNEPSEYAGSPFQEGKTRLRNS
jgi:hypothetical protein